MGRCPAAPLLLRWDCDCASVAVISLTCRLESTDSSPVTGGLESCDRCLFIVWTIVTHEPCWVLHTKKERCSAVSHTGRCFACAPNRSFTVSRCPAPAHSLPWTAFSLPFHCPRLTHSWRFTDFSPHFTAFHRVSTAATVSSTVGTPS